MSSEKPLLYIILGATGSGRREVVADVIEAGLVIDDRARSTVLLASEEPSADVDARLGDVQRWHRDGTVAGGQSDVAPIIAEVPSDATHVFFIADGRTNPVDQLEALRPWIVTGGFELARVICVVHCRLAESHPPLLTWYDACIHFSDIVLLNQREGVSNKWITDFRARYEGKFYPCLFEIVKNGRVKNPALLLEPQARRMSHYFDEEADWVIEGDTTDEDEIAEGTEEITAAPEVDPYFARRAGGRRAKEIPDVATFLENDRGSPST